MTGIGSIGRKAGVVAGALLPLAAAAALTFDDIAREGELRFLPVRPDPGAYRYDAEARIDADSLQQGIVTMRTCHRQLDPNARIVVAFNRERVQSIDIVSTEGVGRAWVEGRRVELADVQRGGSVCIDLRTRALEPAGEGRWRLHAGPLMRRYLDGYLPMEARLRVVWPPGLLQVAATDPAPQPGVTLATEADGATLHVTFAGRLTATWELQRPAPPR
ncbi:MAG: hypothetical protein RMK34_04895 [Tepidimonas sp.]|uniref:hypothetical protein n=1 Tax=Tepidimonas sp. TaxID=2002775 RepID=UPI00298F3C1C|nr:hypothetical protein [Tepidimonas sp.]MCS6810643.1 hypothetical protein [Tepidimonas sp.]MCX7742020.1 hypothetical protein [Tepidimonas sp.]MDW8336291.1 hypothetical protein [Tepidimonas sp.]